MKKITKKLFFEMLNDEYILRDYLNAKTITSEDKIIIYLTYKESVLTFTIYQGKSIWWDCNGYIYWLRAQHVIELMDAIATRCK